MTVRRPNAFVVAVAAACLVLAACGGGTRADTATEKQTVGSNAPALQVTFRLMTPGSDTQAMLDYEVLVQAGKVHLSRVGYPGVTESSPFPARTLTYDGSRLLLHAPDNVIPYQLFEDVAHATGPGDPQSALAEIAPFLPFDATAAYSQLVCPGAKKLQDAKDLGRAAVQYSCEAANGGPSAIWVDKTFGIELSPLLPSGAKFLANPTVDASTFATTPPAGVNVETLGNRKLKPGDPAPGFAITEVPPFVSAGKTAVGQPINSSEFTGRRYVLAFFGESVLFSPEGPEVASLRDLSDLTAGGTMPTVLGVLETAGNFVDKGGIFTTKGWHFRVGYEQTRVQHQFGFTDELDYAFVNADGTISTLHPNAMSKADLQAAIARLK